MVIKMQEHIDKKTAERHSRTMERVQKEMQATVVGQEKPIRSILRGVVSNGHVLIEGFPGVAKTLIMMSMATLTGCSYKRIQFTPDLLPTDITGITSYNPKKGFYTLKGPIFTNFVLADEINRAPAKVQSALLEGMQERKVTIGANTYSLPAPFVVLATQNNIESLGVYPLPAAQIDRFMFKIDIDFPSAADELLVLKKNISSKTFDSFNLKGVTNARDVIKMQQDLHKVYCADELEKYIVDIVHATRDFESAGIKLGRHIEYGASPRASIALYVGAKANALMDGRTFVSPQDIKDVAHDVLRHRIALNYEGQADQVKVDSIIDEILEKTNVP